MKAIYIPKGRTAAYDTLEAERLVVNGCLKVAHGLKAQTISGSGVILAGTISADDIHAREIEAASVCCLRLSAKRVQAAEVFASESATVSCYLCADYVSTARLTAALYEVAELDAGEIVNLPPVKRVHPFWTLLAAILLPFQTALAMVRSVFCAGEVMDAEYRQVQEEPPAEKPKEPRDEELERITAIFKLLRSSGYTLKIIPGTPEENAPVFDSSDGHIDRPAA